MKFRKPPLRIQPTTLWDYPSQHYGDDVQGDPNYRGATPSYIIWNLLQRYTKERDLIVDHLRWNGSRTELTDDVSLIEKHVLDSLDMMKLISLVEEEFEIEIDDCDVVPANFETIGQIAALVEKKGAQRV